MLVFESVAEYVLSSSTQTTKPESHIPFCRKQLEWKHVLFSLKA
jgi:hypothetical protein